MSRLRGCIRLAQLDDALVLLRVSEISSVLACEHHVSQRMTRPDGHMEIIESRTVEGSLVMMANGSRHEIAHTLDEVENDMARCEEMDGRK